MPRTNLFKDEKFQLLRSVTLSDLHEKLGKGFKPRTIQKWIREGKLREGVHYSKGKGKSGRIRIDLEMLQLAIEIGLI